MSSVLIILIFVGLLVALGSLVMRRRQTWLFAVPPRPDGVALGIVLYCVFAVPPRPDGVRAGIMGILLFLGPPSAAAAWRSTRSSSACRGDKRE